MSRPTLAPYPERTAVHEAGHALVALLLGMPVKSLSLGGSPDRDADGLTLLDPPDASPLPDTADHVVRRGLIAVGGMAAECIVFGDHSWGGRYPTTPEKEATAREPLDILADRRSDTSDLGQLRLLTGYLGFNAHDAVLAVVETWIVAVMRRLVHHRGALFDLVEALLEHRQLDAAGIAAALEAGPPPPLSLSDFGLPQYTLAT